MSEKEPISKYMLSWQDNPALIDVPNPQPLIDSWGAERRAMLSNPDPDMTGHYSSLIYQGYGNPKQGKKD